jgi:hypothetical protein
MRRRSLLPSVIHSCSTHRRHQIEEERPTGSHTIHFDFYRIRVRLRKRRQRGFLKAFPAPWMPSSRRRANTRLPHWIRTFQKFRQRQVLCWGTILDGQAARHHHHHHGRGGRWVARPMMLQSLVRCLSRYESARSLLLEEEELDPLPPLHRGWTRPFPALALNKNESHTPSRTRDHHAARFAVDRRLLSHHLLVDGNLRQIFGFRVCLNSLLGWLGATFFSAG